MALVRLLPVRLFACAACAAALIAPVRADQLQDIGKLMKQGQQAQALEQVDKYLSSKPKDAQGRFLKGVILTEMNKTNEAIGVFTKLTEDYPELPEPYNNLAVIYAQQKQYDKAKQALEMAIRTHPSYATAHENLGDIYARLASQAYDKALQIDSSNASAQTKLSTIKDLISVNPRSGAGRVAGKPPMAVAAAEPKPAESKTPEAPKTAETKPEAKPAEVKPPEVKPAETKATESKSAEPKPAEPKPAPVKAEAPKAGDASAEVAKALDGWLAAWSRKDVKGYLAHYAKNFSTPGGESRAAWEAERAKRIGKPGAIQVHYENLRIAVDGDTATARFRQYYRSASLKTGSNKVVVLTRQDGRWLIQQEKIGN